MTYERIVIKNGGYRNYKAEIDPLGEAMIALFNEIKAYHDSGKPVYVEFLKGDRAGSIAILEPHKQFGDRWFRAQIRTSRGFDSNDPDRIEYDCRIYGQLRFAGKSHKPQVDIYPNGEVAWLKGYEGPTVWKKFDVKAAKEKIIAEVVRNDIDGTKLEVGDPVLYVDIRYGYATRLSRGKIKKFEVTVNSERSEVFTIVESDDGVESKISRSEMMVVKIN